MWDECNCAVVWTFLGIVLLWDWNENWPFPVLWPLLNLPNFLAYWVQRFSHFKTINPGQLNTWIPHSICQGKGSIKGADVVQSFPYIALVYINRSNCKAWHSASWLHKGKPGSPSTAYTELGRQGQNQGSACHSAIISTSLTLPKEGPVLLYPSSFFNLTAPSLTWPCWISTCSPRMQRRVCRWTCTQLPLQLEKFSPVTLLQQALCAYYLTICPGLQDNLLIRQKIQQQVSNFSWPLYGSTYTRIFFNSKYYNQFDESSNREAPIQRKHRYRRPGVNHTWIAHSLEAWSPYSLNGVQGSCVHGSYSTGSTWPFLMHCRHPQPLRSLQRSAPVSYLFYLLSSIKSLTTFPSSILQF